VFGERGDLIGEVDGLLLDVELPGFRSPDSRPRRRR
jgi:hypothetical protein